VTQPVRSVATVPGEVGVNRVNSGEASVTTHDDTPNAAPERRQLKQRLRNRLLQLRQLLAPWPPNPSQIHWLWIVTDSNSGSTALSDLLAGSAAATKLHFNGEGQWLVPDLLSYHRGKDLTASIDFGMVRAVWLHEVRKTQHFPCVVIEKSPSNLARMPQLLEAFADMPRKVIRLTRDPYAVSASKAWRYGTSVPEGRFSTAHFRYLGDLCGRRLTELRGLAPISDLTVSYEALTADPAGTMARIAAIMPLLSDVDPGATVEVKDYAQQPLSNMNERQISKMSAEQIEGVTEGLAPYADVVREFGYELR
jgi:hypothetical protein